MEEFRNFRRRSQRSKGETLPVSKFPWQMARGRPGRRRARSGSSRCGARRRVGWSLPETGASIRRRLGRVLGGKPDGWQHELLQPDGAEHHRSPASAATAPRTAEQHLRSAPLQVGPSASASPQRGPAGARHQPHRDLRRAGRGDHTRRWRGRERPGAAEGGPAGATGRQPVPASGDRPGHLSLHRAADQLYRLRQPGQRHGRHRLHDHRHVLVLPRRRCVCTKHGSGRHGGGLRRLHHRRFPVADGRQRPLAELPGPAAGRHPWRERPRGGGRGHQRKPRPAQLALLRRQRPGPLPAGRAVPARGQGRHRHGGDQRHRVQRDAGHRLLGTEHQRDGGADRSRVPGR